MKIMAHWKTPMDDCLETAVKWQIACLIIFSKPILALEKHVILYRNSMQCHILNGLQWSLVYRSIVNDKVLNERAIGTQANWACKID